MIVEEIPTESHNVPPGGLGERGFIWGFTLGFGAFILGFGEFTLSFGISPSGDVIVVLWLGICGVIRLMWFVEIHV